MLTGWVPGSGPLQLPSGVGMTISPGDKLLMQVHYHKDPAVATTADTTAVDLYFSPTTTPEHAYVGVGGDAALHDSGEPKGYAVNSTCTVNGSWKLLGVAPHMHQHATKFKVGHRGGERQRLPHEHPALGLRLAGRLLLAAAGAAGGGRQDHDTCTYDNNTAARSSSARRPPTRCASDSCTWWRRRSRASAASSTSSAARPRRVRELATAKLVVLVLFVTLVALLGAPLVARPTSA